MWYGVFQFRDWVRLIYEDIKLLCVLSTENNQCCATEPTASQSRVKKKIKICQMYSYCVAVPTAFILFNGF